jgi:hypothetical protein
MKFINHLTCEHPSMFKKFIITHNRLRVEAGPVAVITRTDVHSEEVVVARWAQTRPSRIPGPWPAHESWNGCGKSAQSADQRRPKLTGLDSKVEFCSDSLSSFGYETSQVNIFRSI